MLNILPVKSTPYPTIRSCIDDSIQSVAEGLSKGNKCMYGNAWQLSYEDQQSPDQQLIERVHIPHISREYLAEYHGIQFSYIARDDSFMDSHFMLDMLESQLASGMPVLVGFDSYDCPWCVAYRRLHTSHACLAIGLDRLHRRIELLDAYYGRPHEIVDFDEFEQACHFYAIFTECEETRSPANWHSVLQHTLLNPANDLPPAEVADHLRVYADSYLETGISAESPAEYSSYFLMAANSIPISRVRYSLFLNYIAGDSNSAVLKRIAASYQYVGEQWHAINQFIIKVMCSGNKLDQRSKIHKKMHEMINIEEQMLQELESLVV
ncbi:cysteine peptidase family C39 domain-containing protein [Paenibacillus sp. BAC0078]